MKHEKEETVKSRTSGEQLEDMIDEMNDESFPASDPPNWSSLVRKKKEVPEEDIHAKKEPKKGAV